MANKRVVELLTADYQNVQAEIENIKNMMAELEAKRDAARIKLEFLKKAIESDVQHEMSLEPAASGVMKLPEVNPTGSSLQSATSLAGPQQAVGFRVAIREVLKSAHRGMRPRDICNELMRRGVPFEGKLDPKARTYNELWRMAKNGSVRKRGPLFYAQEESIA